MALLSGCGGPENRARAVYMLLDTSGTYTQQLDKASNIVSYLLMRLDSGDSLAVARIDSGSFSEKDIIERTTFDERPSVANNQKRKFRSIMDEFVKTAKSSAYTDISGGMLQAVEWLKETGAGDKTILIFSDLKEELAKGQIRKFELQLDGVHVVALNVTKLNSDNIDPREYLTRVDQWERKVLKGGGSWKVINDLEKVDGLLQG
ncbi:MAG: VWA domain-containing protein [Gammaproteobacteria bacterium]|nr:VWA domain-containing protein [Gammaproteobacteria bacterium]